MFHELKTGRDFFIKTYLRMLWFCIALVVLLNITNAIQIFNKPWESHPIRLFMLGTEHSPAAWISSAFLLIAALLALACRATSSGAQRLGWLALAGILLVMSVDETAEIHERLGDAVNSRLEMTLSFGWIIPAVVIIILIGLMARFIWRLPGATRKRIILATVVFVFGASVVDLVGGLYGVNAGTDNYLYYILETIEENFEMCGELLLMTALALHASQNGFSITIQPRLLPGPESVVNSVP